MEFVGISAEWGLCFGRGGGFGEEVVPEPRTRALSTGCSFCFDFLSCELLVPSRSPRLLNGGEVAAYSLALLTTAIQAIAQWYVQCGVETLPHSLELLGACSTCRPTSGVALTPRRQRRLRRRAVWPLMRAAASTPDCCVVNLLLMSFANQGTVFKEICKCGFPSCGGGAFTPGRCDEIPFC